MKTGADMQCMNKNLRSWDPLGFRSSVGCTANLNYESANSEQFHLRRCDHCQWQSLIMGCQIFQGRRSADPRQLLWLKGPAVVVEGANLVNGVLLRAAPLIQGHRREQQVRLAADRSSGAG